MHFNTQVIRTLAWSQLDTLLPIVEQVAVAPEFTLGIYWALSVAQGSFLSLRMNEHHPGKMLEIITYLKAPWEGHECLVCPKSD